MTARRGVAIGASVAGAALVTWVLFSFLPRWSTRQVARSVTVPPPATTPAAVRKIKAHLFYVADDGEKLEQVDQDVAYAERPVDQARAILAAQLTPVAAPLVSAIPQGTTLRAVFITPAGEAFVDLSKEATAAHPGGSQNELLTIYTIVHALTLNLPAVNSVQILVDGKEVETLAGHVDLRRPLTKNVQFTVQN